MSTTLVRTVDTATVPTAGTYSIDPAHSAVEFSVRHLGLSKTRGRFQDFSGDVTIAEEPTASSVSVEIRSDSFHTGNPDRDGHVKSADFLDVDNFPALVFRSTAVRRDGDQWVLDGDLTIKDVTRPVSLAVEFQGSEQDPWGNGRIGFSASTKIDREEFGVTWNQVLETGGVLVGKTVTIDLDVQAVAA